MDTIEIKRDGGPLIVDTHIGQAIEGAYAWDLFDSDGKNPLRFASGFSSDNVPDTAVVPKTAPELDGRILGYQVALAAPDDETDHRFFVRLRFEQDGVRVHQIVREGQFKNGKVLIGFRKVRAQ